MPDFLGGVVTDNTVNDPSGSGANNAGVTIDQVNQAINAALTSREKRLQKTIFDQLTGSDSPLIQSISEIKEQLEATTSKFAKANPNGKPKRSSEDSELPEEFREKFELLQKETERLKKQNETSATELQRERNEKINNARRETQLSAIKSAGFETRAEALAALHREKNIVRWDGDDGQVGKPVVDVDGMDIPYEQFLKERYAKTDEAKIYLDSPLREGSGAGAANQYSGFQTQAGTVFGKQIDSMSGAEAADALSRLTGG